MASLLFKIFSGIFGTGFKALAFRGTHFVFSRLTDHGKEEQKGHKLKFEKLQRTRDN